MGSGFVTKSACMSCMSKSITNLQSFKIYIQNNFYKIPNFKNMSFLLIIIQVIYGSSIKILLEYIFKGITGSFITVT
jgi:hypothetical protein